MKNTFNNFSVTSRAQKKSLQMKSSTKNAFKSKKIPLFNVLIATYVMAFITTLIPLVFKQNLPPEVPLFYGLPEGERQLTKEIGLAIPGVFSLVMTIINTSLAFFMEDRFLKQSLLLASFGITLLAFITVLKISFLVGSF